MRRVRFLMLLLLTQGWIPQFDPTLNFRFRQRVIGVKDLPGE